MLLEGLPPFLYPQCLPVEAPSLLVKWLEQVGERQSDHKQSETVTHGMGGSCYSKYDPWISSIHITQELVPKHRFHWNS